MTGTRSQIKTLLNQYYPLLLLPLLILKKRNRISTVDPIDSEGISEDSQVLYRFLANKFDTKFDEIAVMLESRDRKIEHLQRENVNLKRDMRRLEERLENVEMLDRQNDIVVSGNAIPYSSASENTTEVFIDMLKKKNELYIVI